jgi:hypothetical protein
LALFLVSPKSAGPLALAQNDQLGTFWPGVAVPAKAEVFQELPLANVSLGLALLAPGANGQNLAPDFFGDKIKNFQLGSFDGRVKQAKNLRIKLPNGGAKRRINF